MCQSSTDRADSNMIRNLESEHNEIDKRIRLLVCVEYEPYVQNTRSFKFSGKLRGNQPRVAPWGVNIFRREPHRDDPVRHAPQYTGA